MPPSYQQKAVKQVAQIASKGTHTMHYFFLYAITFIVYGQVVTSIGPLFPYMSAQSGRIQTQYSVIFTSRAFGYLSGSLTAKYLENKFSLHQFIAFGIFLIGIFGALFAFCESLVLQAILFYPLSCGCSYITIGINGASLKAFKSQSTSKLIQLLHGFFGIGGLIGPLNVYIFQLYTFLDLSIAAFVILGFYFYLPSPQLIEHSKDKQQTNSSPQVSKKSIYLICSMFFMVIGQQCTYGGWVSSYAVLKKFSSKEHATLFSSQFWILITVFRFAFAYIKGTSSQKIQILGAVGAINSFLSYFLLHYVNSQFGLNFMSIVFGISNSSLFALLFTITEQFGLSFTLRDMMLFVVWGSLGEGVLSVGIGKAMEYISYDYFIWGMMTINILLTLICIENEKQMIKEKQRVQSSLHIKLVDICHDQRADPIAHSL